MITSGSAEHAAAKRAINAERRITGIKNRLIVPP